MTRGTGPDAVQSPNLGMRHSMSVAGDDTSGRPRRRRMEIFAFLFLTAVLMPALAIATVGSYGLAVWIYQMAAGPPGPPAR
jgi:nitrate reductase NapE